MFDFLKNDDVINTIFIVMICVFSLLIIFSMIQILRNNIKQKERREKILFPEKLAHALNSPEGKKKLKKKKKFFLKKFYDEYVFFYRNGKPLIIIGIIGYAITVLILYIVSSSLPLAFVFSISFLVIEYIFVDGKTAKARKKYIKDFASAINVLATSTEAGNTFEMGIASIVVRDTIGEKVRYEFSLINNNLKNNKSREEALEEFYKRNSGFQEIAMFVVVVQFFSKKGGDGLRDIFNELSQSLSTKINNYSEIDAEIGIYKILMNAFIYLYFVLLFVINLFMPTFYANLIDQSFLGVVKAGISIGLYVFGIWFYKTMLRNSAEG